MDWIPKRERHPNSLRPTHSRLSVAIERNLIDVYLLYLLELTNFSMKTRPERAQDQNRASASPSGTACLIGKKLIKMAPQVCPPASSRTPWSAKTSQMGQSYPATPKISNFPAPNLPSSEQKHLFKIWSHDCLSAYIPALLHTPALPSTTLGRPTTLPTHLKDPISNSNQPRHSGSTLLFEKNWLVGTYPYGCMK